jgi:glutamate synthase (NADPH) large chain
MTSVAEKLALQQTGLYDPSQEHDACGVGFVAHIKGKNPCHRDAGFEDS